jgi:uncharacterized protein YqeY
MSLMDELKKQMLDAFKCKRIAEKDILRLVIGKAQTLEANLNKPLLDDQIELIIRKEIKNNNESLASLKEGSEGFNRVIAESIALNKFLPATLTQDEIEVRLVDLVSKICDAEKDGQAMGIAMNLLKSTDQKVDSDDVKAVVVKIRNK